MNIIHIKFTRFLTCSSTKHNIDHFLHLNSTRLSNQHEYLYQKYPQTQVSVTEYKNITLTNSSICNRI